MIKPILKVTLAAVLFAGFVSCKESQKTGANKENSNAAGQTATATVALDKEQIISDIQFLSSKECEGRRPGSKGHQLALDLVLSRMRASGLDSIGGSIIQNFTGRSLNGYTEGRNVVAFAKGKKYPDQYMVLTAHYDHVGKRGDTAWFAGADDNASGSAAAMAIAGYLGKNQPDYSIIVALLDREETGLEGAYALVEYLKKTLGESAVRFNLNLDMIGRNDKNELYVCGTRHYPELAEVVKTVQEKTTVKLPMGHDGGTGKPSDDWTNQSDHYAFHKAGIPFLYLGVEDHADYHKTTDTFDKFDQRWYLNNCEVALLFLKALDEKAGR